MRAKSNCNCRTIDYPNYNLKGKEIKVKLRDPWDADLYKDVWLPCYVLEEYKKFIRVIVLPHYNPNRCFDVSKPYKMCLSKMGIHFGEIKIKVDNSIVR